MKKYSLIIVLCLTLIVGGVFATWDYVDTNAQQQELNPQNITIAAKNSVANGTITVNGNVALIIDQASLNSAEGVLKESANDIEITWEGNAGKEQNLEWIITGSVTIDGPTTIISVKDSNPVAITGNTISTSDILSKLQLENVNLPDATAHEEFATALQSQHNTLVITIREAQ